VPFYSDEYQGSSFFDYLARHRPDGLLVSAERRWGLDELLARIDAALAAARSPLVAAR